MGGAAGQARPHLSSSTASTPQEGPVEEPAVQQTATVQPPASIAKPQKIGEASDVALTEVNTSGASGQAPRHPPNSENSRVTGEEAGRELRYERETAGLAGRNEHVFQWMDHAGGPYSPFHSHGVQACHPGLQTALPSSMVRIQRKWSADKAARWGLWCGRLLVISAFNLRELVASGPGTDMDCLLCFFEMWSFRVLSRAKLQLNRRRRHFTE